MGREARLGVAEYAGLAGLVLVAALVGWAVKAGWAIAIVPGVTYVLASGVAYGLYRQYRREEVPQMSQTQAQGQASESLRAEGALAWRQGPVAFRVVGEHGKCPLGITKGQTVSLDPSRKITPKLCRHAEAVLRLAATEEIKAEGIKEWCCPVYDHLLVFRREAPVQTA